MMMIDLDYIWWKEYYNFIVFFWIKKKVAAVTYIVMNKRKMIVHTLTEDERNICIDLTTDEIDEYLL
jgi:hypothetical protein